MTILDVLEQSTPVDGLSDQSIPVPQVHSHWNFRSVVFRVENTLFSVLKHGFLVPGTVFETMFSLPPSDPKNVEGSSDDNPIILEDTLVDDFDAFLRVMYPIGVVPVQAHTEWMGVLRLSHKWGFAEIRQKAIQSLSPHISKLDSHEKISIGSRFLVREWFKEGIIDIAVNRDLEIDSLKQHPFCFDEAIILKFFYIQSKSFEHTFPPHYGYGGYRCPHCDTRSLQQRNVHYCAGSYREVVTGLVTTYFSEQIDKISFSIIEA